MERRDKYNYYLDIAQTVAERGTCLRRNFGAIIVNNDEIISTGYSGAPRGRKNCNELGTCIRAEMNIPRGERYELCRSVHAEANAFISAARRDIIGSTIYLVCVDAQTGDLVDGTSCCSMCKRLVINSGVSKVVIRDDENKFRVIYVDEWIENDDSLSGEFGY